MMVWIFSAVVVGLFLCFWFGYLPRLTTVLRSEYPCLARKRRRMMLQVAGCRFHHKKTPKTNFTRDQSSSNVPLTKMTEDSTSDLVELDPTEYKDIELGLRAFVLRHETHHRPIAVVTSGGTAADLE